MTEYTAGLQGVSDDAEPQAIVACLPQFTSVSRREPRK